MAINIKAVGVTTLFEKVGKILADKSVEVRMFGDQAYCEYDENDVPIRVVVPALSDSAGPEVITAVFGYLDHEIAHVLFTDMMAIRAWTESFPDKRKGLAHKCQNAFEDAMIERNYKKKYIGSHKTLSATETLVAEKSGENWVKNLAMVYSKMPDDKKRERFISIGVLPSAVRAARGNQHFIDHMEPIWPYVPTMKTFMDKYKDEIRALDNTPAAIDMTQRFFDEVLDLDDEDEVPEEEDDKSGDGDEGEKGDDKSDDKSEEGSNSSEGDAQDDDGEGQESDDAGSDDGDEKESGEGGSGGEDEDNDDDADGTDGGPDSGDEESDDDSEGDDDGDGSSDGDSDEDAEADGDNGGGSEAGDDGDTGDDGDDKSDAEGDGDDTDGDAGGDDTGGKPSAGGDRAGKGGKSDGSGDESDGEFESDEGDSDELTDAELAAAMEMMGDFAEAMQHIIASMADKENEEYRVFTRDFDLYSPPPENPHLVADMETATKEHVGPIASRLARVLKARSFSRRVGGYRRGKLSGNALHRLTTGDDRVFHKKEVHTTKEVAVSVLVDCSGSMGGEKMTLATEAAFASMMALQRAGVVCEVTGFTDYVPGPNNSSEDYNSGQIKQWIDEYTNGKYDGTIVHDSKYSRTIPLRHYQFKSFDEGITPQVKSRLATFHHRSTQSGRLAHNIDGESVLFAAKRLSERKEPRKLLLVYSDGSPYGHNNDRDKVNHLKDSVKAITKAGIDTFGIGIMDENVRHYYPDNDVIYNMGELADRSMDILSRYILAGTK